jgi:hypothetical protein
MVQIRKDRRYAGSTWKDSTRHIGAVSHAVELKVGGNFVEKAQSSSCLLLEEGTRGYVMPIFTGSESRDVT